MLMLSHIAEPRPRYLVTPSDSSRVRGGRPTTALACLFFAPDEHQKGVSEYYPFAR